MKLWTFAAAAACALATVVGAGAASAELITFDDLVTNQSGYDYPIANGYAGLDWSMFGAINGSVYCGGSPCGYVNGAVSGHNVAYNYGGDPASFSRATPFTLNSFDVTAAWRNGLNVTVTGLRNGVVEDTASFSVDTSGPILETLNWSNINEVEFVTSSGGSTNNQLALDNINVAVPEPATWAMLILGVAMVGFAARRRREGAFVAG